MITICPLIHFSFLISFEKKKSIFIHTWLDDEDIKGKTLLWVKEKQPSWFCQRDPATMWPGMGARCPVSPCVLAGHPAPFLVLPLSHTMCYHSPIWLGEIPFTKLGLQKQSTKNLLLFLESHVGHVDLRLRKYTAVQDKTDPSTARAAQVMSPQDCQNRGRYP